ncbi:MULTISPECIES: hypothetical protein [unclassified Mesorhizobium]|uniref:hypothetical protein n=1 Tax=unclassified Mesorhizobium TaxID=325217 RepID=UPI00112B5A84|nr:MULTISPECIES: hypothetical protein [unclassified Mesorhizobium]TPM06778.1 hypothetical protein FJ939_11990 [Mesorhizobium sp. B2-3-8]TPM15339.1 hypothetical protein FJ940_14115 [Mesorhizobium sp. B2-3-7]
MTVTHDEDENLLAAGDDGQAAVLDHESQVREFRDALKQALNTVNIEIAASGGRPGIDAVMTALTSLQAEFIAMAPSRFARRMQIKEIERELPRLVALRTGGTLS